MENDDTELNNGEEEMMNTDEDDSEDGLLELDDEDDGDIDMDDIRLFDETDLCVPVVSQDEEIIQETSNDVKPDIGTLELCPLDSSSEVHGKEGNKDTSSLTPRVELIISGDALSQDEEVKQEPINDVKPDIETPELCPLDSSSEVHGKEGNKDTSSLIPHVELIISGDALSQDEEVKQEPSNDVKPDIDPPELCRLDSSSELHGKEGNKNTSSLIPRVELIISDDALSQENLEKSLSKDVLGTSQNVSSETKAIIQTAGESVTEDKNVTLPQAGESAPLYVLLQAQVNEGQQPGQGETSKPRHLPDNQRPKVSFSDTEGQNNLEQSKIVSDIDDIRLIKPKVRKSPRKVDKKETETIATVNDLRSKVVTLTGDVKTAVETGQSISPPTSRSERNSPEVVSTEGQYPPGDVEMDHFISENDQSEAGQHTCYLCGLGFNCKNNLIVHIRTTHSYYPELHPYGCTHCGTQFKSEALVISHEQSVHSFNTSCAFCGKKQSTKEDLENHVCNHLQSLTYLCMLCREDFPNVFEAEKHLSNHKGEVAFWSDFLKCRFCGSLFSKREKLYAHLMKTHEDLFDVKCKSCSQQFYKDSALAVHRSDQNHRLNGKRIRVNENVHIQYDIIQSEKGSKDLIDISEDDSIKSQNETSDLGSKNGINKGGTKPSQQNPLTTSHLSTLDTNVKDSSNTTPRSDDNVASQLTLNTITAKHSIIAKLLTRTPSEPTSTPSNHGHQVSKKSIAAPVHDSVENSFQRIMFRVASKIQELLCLSLTIEGHVTQQSHQFLAKVYDQKFKVVMVLWTELHGLTKAVNANVFAKGPKLSKELVDELLCGILKNVHSLRKSKLETILLMGRCIDKSFQELIKIMIDSDTILTPGLQAVAVNHFEHWLDFFPTAIDSQWEVFKELAANHTGKNEEVLELVGRLCYSRIALNKAVDLKKEENEKWKKGVHPVCEKTLAKPAGVKLDVQAKENMKQLLFKMSNDTAVFVAGKNTPVAINSVEPGTKVLIPVTKLPPGKQGGNPDNIDILPGTQSSNPADKANKKSHVATLPGFLSNEQHEGYRLVYISEGFLQEGLRPVSVSKPQQSISIDLVSDEEENDDGEFENTEDNIEYSDDDHDESAVKTSDSHAEGLMMDCVEDDPIGKNTPKKKKNTKKTAKVRIVTDKEDDAEDMDLDCVTIKPEPLDYNNVTVDLCLIDDDDDNEDFEEKKGKGEDDKKKDPVSLVIVDSENKEEIKIVLAEDDDSTRNKMSNTSPQVKQEETSEGNTGAPDPTQLTRSTLTGSKHSIEGDNSMAPPNKMLKLVKVFSLAASDDTSVEDVNSPLGGETTQEPAATSEVKAEPTQEVILSGETIVNLKKEPESPNHNKSQSTTSNSSTFMLPEVKSEPVESESARQGSVAADSVEESKIVVQETLNSQEGVKRENCDTLLSDSEVLKAYYIGKHS